jgi:hypothetical protein
MGNTQVTADAVPRCEARSFAVLPGLYWTPRRVLAARLLPFKRGSLLASGTRSCLLRKTERFLCMSSMGSRGEDLRYQVKPTRTKAVASGQPTGRSAVVFQLQDVVRIGPDVRLTATPLSWGFPSLLAWIVRHPGAVTTRVRSSSPGRAAADRHGRLGYPPGEFARRTR